MSSIIIDLTITAEQYLKHYQVSGAVVVTRSRDGRRVQFPAGILQRFVTHGGVEGSFEISFNDQGKFSSIRRL